jgi:hypothetical protein
MNQLKFGDLGVSQGTVEGGGPVTPLPVYESLSIIPPSLSLKQRDPEDRSASLIRRSALQQRQFEDRISGSEPETDSSWAIGLVYMNENQLPSMELLHCAILQYIRVRGEAPRCLYVSSELQNDVRQDMEVVYSEAFNGAIPWRVVQSIPIHFSSNLSRDRVMGYTKDFFLEERSLSNPSKP